MELEPNTAQFDLATDIGRSQVFGLIGSQCTAAQAVCMRQIRESEAYKTTGLTWEDFCPRHLGVHRATADRIIGNLEELGTAYFQLSQVMQVSAERYRELAPKIEDGKIEIGGEMVPLAPENAERIRQAVGRRRKPRSKVYQPPDVGEIENRLGEELKRLMIAVRQGSPETRQKIITLIDSFGETLRRIRWDAGNL